MAIFLSAFYMLLIIGFPISIHQCNIQGVSSMSIGLEESSSCASPETISCCENSLSVESKATISSCCSNEAKAIQWNSNHQISILQILDNEIKEFVIIPSLVSNEQLLIETHTFETQLDFESPPEKPISIYILKNQLIFYG